MRLNTLMAAGILTFQAVLGPLAMAGMADQGQPAGVLTGFVVPSEVGANEPFTFAATGVVEGEVISVKTLEGEVVQTKKTDKLGRVFLAAGLAAGSYLLSTSGGKGQSKVEIQPPRNITSGGPLSLTNTPSISNVADGLTLKGSGMSLDLAQHQITAGGKQFPILAGTATEVKTGPLPTSVCGEGPIELKNTKTGESAKIDNVVFYSLSAKLGRTKLVGGEQTALEFTFLPKSLKASVNARILSGPVSFGGGAKEKMVEIVNGSGRAPLHADPASQGPFRVAYDLTDIVGSGKTGAPTEPGNPTREKCPLTKHERMSAGGWHDSETTIPDPDNPGKEKKVYRISRTVSCSIRKSCSKMKGHGGECAFTGASACDAHTITETRDFNSERERTDGKKDTKIPDGLKFPKE